MACESCGERPKKANDNFTKAVIEINNPEQLILFRKVIIPASLGDDESVPPVVGKYYNVLLHYEANNHNYLYSSDGIPTLLSAEIPQEIFDKLADLEDGLEELAQEVEDIKNNPDVVDIVDTYADLQNYNTSGLTDKDIIRVIADETKGGLSSYYRWNSPNLGWNFIGVIPGGDGVKELSSADYNYPTANPDRVALWLLNNGLYTAPAGVMVAASTTSYPWYNTSDKAILIGGSDTVKGIYTFLNGKVDVVTTQVSDGTEADEYTLLKSNQVSQTTGQSTTDIMSQKAITDALANAGGIKILTTADYNYPENNPNTVALWLLEDGLYMMPDANSNVSVTGAIDGSNYTRFNNMFTRHQVRYVFKYSPYYWVFKDSSMSDNYLYNRGSIFFCTINGATGYFSSSKDSQDITYSALYNNLTTATSGDAALDAYQGKVLKDLIDSLVIKGTGAPTTSTVGTVGQLYEDTTNGDLYICTTVSGSTYTWEEVGAGGGSGPTVVQTTGTSTTDVMSQNAVSSMVFADPDNTSKVRIGSFSSVGNFASNGIAIGTLAATNGDQATAVGYFSQAVGEKSLALGRGATASPGFSVALGAGATPSSVGEINISTGQIYPTSGYNGTNYRLITGVHDPVSAHDAATKGYVDTNTPTITMQTTDPGEGQPLAANNFIAVYNS